MAKDDGTQALTDAQHARFARGFLDRYLTPAFGSLTKSELDLLVFSLLHEVGYVRPSDSQYDIARRLRVTPSRVRSLTMQMELRDTSQTEASLVTRIVDCLSTARFVKDGAMISFGVEDPLLSADIAARLKSLGAITDSSFNREIVKVPRDAFADLVSTLLPPDRREMVRKALIQAGVPDGSWRGVLRGALAKAAEKIAGAAGEEVTKEIQDLAGPAIKDLFASVAKQITARWRGLLT
jgi:hypothetical protein